MQSHATSTADAARRHRPKTLTVFAAAFAAGAVLAYGVNRVVDVHVVRSEPQVESEPIFVALRSLPQGAPITVWDVALKDWPKAMLPTTALRADASLEGMVLRHPIREGQPLLSVQLARDVAAAPMTAIVAVPGEARVPAPADSAAPTGRAPPVMAATGTVAERFVPATPAEPAAAATADIGPVTVPANPPETAATVPAADPAPALDSSPAVEPAPVSAPVSAPPAVIVAAPAAAPAAVPAPRSTDVDEPATLPVVATPAVAAAPAVAAPVEPTPAPRPVPLPLPAPPALEAPAVTDVACAPLAAPVPALPSTDIGRSLTSFGRAHQPPAADAPPAERHESVLDRTTEAATPAAAQPAPKYHLVVPERIALAVDASFTQQPTTQPEVVERTPVAERSTREAQAHAQAQAPSSQSRSGTQRQPAPQPSAARKPAPQPQRQQPAARPQATPTNRGLNAWMPRFMGESRQR